MKKPRTTVLACLIPIAASLVACSSSSGSGGGATDAGDSDVTSTDGGTKKPDSGTVTHTDAGHGGKGDTGVPTSPASAYCMTFLTAEGKAAAQCLGGTAADWQAELAAGISCAELGAAVTAGRVAYSSSEGATCLSALENIDCSTVTSTNFEPAACTAALAGAVPPGHTCDSNLDCGTGAYCAGLGGPTGSCTGMCTAQLTAGASCTAYDICADNNICVGSPATCTVPATPVGMGATCIYDSTTMKGAPLCQAGLACDLTTFTCVTPVAPGDPCPTGHGICAAFTYCDPTSMTCKADPGLGGRCGGEVTEDLIPCTGNTYCKGATTTSNAGTCTALEAAGATCQSSRLSPADGVCASGSCSASDGGAGVCAAVCTAD